MEQILHNMLLVVEYFGIAAILVITGIVVIGTFAAGILFIMVGIVDLVDCKIRRTRTAWDCFCDIVLGIVFIFSDIFFIALVITTIQNRGL